MNFAVTLVRGYLHWHWKVEILMLERKELIMSRSWRHDLWKDPPTSPLFASRYITKIERPPPPKRDLIIECSLTQNSFPRPILYSKKKVIIFRYICEFNIPISDRSGQLMLIPPADFFEPSTTLCKVIPSMLGKFLLLFIAVCHFIQNFLRT